MDIPDGYELRYEPPWEYHERNPAAPGMGVYVVRAGPFVKVGRSDDVRLRIADIQTHCPYECEPVGFIPTVSRQDAADTEYFLHHELARWRTHGEWFRAEPELEAYFKDLLAPWPSHPACP